MQKRKAPEIGKSYRMALLPELRSIDEKARTIEFRASTEAVDRYGDVIRTAGWQLDNYRKNPIFLWAHRSGDPPIGKCVAIGIENSPPALVQKIQFATGQEYPFELYAGGYLRGVSVGFLPLEMQPYTDLEGNNTGGVEFLEQELLELSACPIPANPEALAKMVQKGFSESDLARVFSGEELAAKSSEPVTKESAEASLQLAYTAADVAIKAAQQALANLKALRVQSEEPIREDGEISLAELCAAVKQAGDEMRGSEEDLES
jgi:hypothetical protein